MKVEGNCHCGRIKYEAEVDPEKAYLCHCADCQMLSGSAFRVSISAPSETFKLLSGQPKIYVKTAESGRKRVQSFCPDCGTPIYSAAVENTPAYVLRVGCLRQRTAIRPKRQIWCQDALDWTMNLDTLEKADRQ